MILFIYQYILYFLSVSYKNSLDKEAVVMASYKPWYVSDCLDWLGGSRTWMGVNL